MKKKILAIVTAFFVAISIFSFGDIEAYASTSLSSKKVYYISNYCSGDCTLSANVYMMRRAAIKRGSKWSGITNGSARKKLCYSFNGMKYDYSYHSDNLKFIGAHGYLPGGYAANKRKLKALLKKHPEGIVVHGYDSYGPHGVLITGYKNGTFYCADSAKNSRGRNVGITTFGNSSMASLSGCRQYWYLKSVVYDKYTLKYRDGLSKSPKGQTVIYSKTMKSKVRGRISSKKFVRKGYHYSSWYITKYDHGKLHYLCKHKNGKTKWLRSKEITSKYKKIAVSCGGTLKLRVKNKGVIILRPKWIKDKPKIEPAKENTVAASIQEKTE